MVATKLSLTEYLSLDNSPDTRCEFVDGEIIEMAPEGKLHAHLNGSAADYIREKLAGKARVREAKPILRIRKVGWVVPTFLLLIHQL